MHTVFSHIIQKMFSKRSEDVATDALAYILDSSEAAQRGMMRLLCRLVDDLPLLRFETQRMSELSRPDMRGTDGTTVRAFIENKFWAGLTEKQPVPYLEKLAACGQRSVLLVIGPARREPSLWHELTKGFQSRLDVVPDAGEERISMSDVKEDGILRFATIGIKPVEPVLALTSWDKVIKFLEQEAAADSRALADLFQLRALCDAANAQAFIPYSREQLTDQEVPALILQLSLIVQKTVADAVGTNLDNGGILKVLNIKLEAGSRGRLNERHSWDRIGRYVRISGEQGVGAWFGIHFNLWKSHGATPLWLVFPDSEFGQASAVRQLIEPWAKENKVLICNYGRKFAIGLHVAVGEEEVAVRKSLVNDLKGIAAVLAKLPPKASASEQPETDDDVT